METLCYLLCVDCLLQHTACGRQWHSDTSRDEEVSCCRLGMNEKQWTTRPAAHFTVVTTLPEQRYAAHSTQCTVDHRHTQRRQWAGGCMTPYNAPRMTTHSQRPNTAANASTSTDAAEERNTRLLVWPLRNRTSNHSNNEHATTHPLTQQHIHSLSIHSHSSTIPSTYPPPATPSNFTHNEDCYLHCRLLRPSQPRLLPRCVHTCPDLLRLLLRRISPFPLLCAELLQ